MEQRLWMILQLFGGAALFLYSMDTLTDALQQAAGDTLRQALARLTAHPLAGVLTGAAVTAVVQSSSAVTVLVLGLVGAGLLTLQRAVPVVFGANIGTTVTAQLLAFRLEDARYLLLVAGLLLWFAGRGRLHAAGQALFAFGLLFEGIAVMAEAMEPLAAGPVFRQWMAQVRHRPGLGLLAGHPVCLGQHTNICVGRPLTNPARIPSLCTPEGEFKPSRAYRDAAKAGKDFPGRSFTRVLNGSNVSVKVVQCDVRVFLVTLSKAPYIHRAVIIELDRQDSYTVKNGLYMAFFKLAGH